MARVGVRRAAVAAVVFTGLVAVGTAALLGGSIGDDEPARRALGPNGVAEVRGPVPWVLLGAGLDGKSVVVLPLESTGGCKYGWATAKIPSPTIQIRASLRRRNCRVEQMDLGPPTVVTVPIPGPIPLHGQRIGGPEYQGVGDRNQLIRATRTAMAVTLPSVEGLRLDVARQILRRLGAAEVEVAGPSGEGAFVRTQWPPPGTRIASTEYRSGERRTLATPNTLLVTGGPPRARDYDGHGLTCATLRRYGITQAEFALFRGAGASPDLCPDLPGAAAAR